MNNQQLLDADLMDSIEKYDFDRFKHLLEDGADPNSLHFQRHVGFMTPLMEASNDNDSRYVIELLKYGADPNIITDSGFALQHALMNDNSIRVLYLLLKNGANPFLKDEDGDTAYDMAIIDNHIPETELLKDAMLRRLQSRTRRFLTRKRVKRNKRLALAKHMLDDGNLTDGNSTSGNPMSYMDYDTMLKVSGYM
jgi:ankyrin repeat protein